MERDTDARLARRSGPSGSTPAPSLAPEHEWSAAARLLHPALRPAGTTGVDGRRLDLPAGSGLPGKPLIVAGPAGLALGYVMPGEGFGVLVGAEHLLAWGVGPDQVHAAAMANLAVWSSETPWIREMSGRRTVIWSDAGRGMDAARILLPEVRAQLAGEFIGESGGFGRILVGLPERDLLIVTGLTEGDDEFAALFAGYVAERWHGADDPIAPRLFELAGGELIALDPT